jgi:hypothetical protein
MIINKSFIQIHLLDLLSVPEGHWLHKVDPPCEEKVPGMQGRHVSDPFTAEYVPAGHSTHAGSSCVVFARQKWPAWQSVHPEAPACVVENPAVQLEQTVAPSCPEKDPLAQGRHVGDTRAVA